MNMRRRREGLTGAIHGYMLPSAMLLLAYADSDIGRRLGKELSYI